MIGESEGNQDQWDILSGNKQPISLGYFGRVDVAPVNQFKEYMALASMHDADFTGSRKQLLLYPLDGETSGQITIRPAGEDEKNRLPFQPAGGGNPYFCCLSILNINQQVKDRMLHQLGYEKGIRQIAKCISQQLDQFAAEPAAIQKGWKLNHAVMGLLGTEDLCIITLSDHFEMLTGAINHCRGLIDKNNPGTPPVVVNSHSILMVDYGVQLEDAEQTLRWGTAIAEIHFSLKTAEGKFYLQQLLKDIEAHASGYPVKLETRMGEYDAVIRCPASALGPYLYSYNGEMNYRNVEYRSKVYQSETILYTEEASVKIEVELGDKQADSPRQSDTDSVNSMKEYLEDAVKQINKSILGTEDDPHGDTAYIRQMLFRLLKDFMQISSIPFGGTFQQDLHIQFQASVNAVEYAAHMYHETKVAGPKAQTKFDTTVSRIIDALSNSMQAASQIDRLCFEEQPSHLLNTGAYHKVLVAYYGIVKEFLTIIYALPHQKDSQQPLLIPLLSFGYTRVIQSEMFDTFYKASGRDTPARLICIILPYQALTNVPKYIGPLAHEIFHYATPTDRTLRNDAVGKCLTAAALKLFLSEAASGIPELPEPFGLYIFNRYRQDFLNVVDGMFQNTMVNIRQFEDSQPFAFRADGKTDKRQATRSDLLFSSMYYALTPQQTGSPQEALYCESWLELRSLLRKRKDVDEAVQTFFQMNLSEEDARTHAFRCYHKNLALNAHAIQRYLFTYEMALREIPPDLFDIFCVMHGKANELKAKQYLWQIHSIRSDRLYYYSTGEDDRTVAYLGGNPIRIGLILDYLIFGALDEKKLQDLGMRRERIKKLLQSWYGKDLSGQSGRQAQEREKNLRAITNDYARYDTESFFANIMLGSYFQQIWEQLSLLLQIECIEKKITKLTDFYRRYYDALDCADEALDTTSIFDLAIQMIETYQQQPKLDRLLVNQDSTLVQKSVAGPSGYLTTRGSERKFELRALSPASLQDCVLRAYEYMHLYELKAPIWFRGQRLERWDLFPVVMRKYNEHGFLREMRRVLTLAKGKILPQGRDFCKAEWLALLRHYEFPANLLDWSEDLLTALYFALEDWIKDRSKPLEGDAAIYMLNPILFNLASNMLARERELQQTSAVREDYQKSRERLLTYLQTGQDNGLDYAIPLFNSNEDTLQYARYFDLSLKEEPESSKIYLPIAARTPANNDRMKMQSGAFTFCDVLAKIDDKTDSYRAHELTCIQNDYFASIRKDIPSPIPFLFKIILNSSNSQEFVRYIHAIGMRKYRVYPELVSLKEDIVTQGFG